MQDSGCLCSRCCIPTQPAVFADRRYNFCHLPEAESLTLSLSMVINDKDYAKIA